MTAAPAKEPQTPAWASRAKAAWSKRDEWEKVLSEAYDYVAPHRRSTRRGTRSPSAKTDRLFDPHAAVALQRAVGRLMEDVFPSGEKYCELEPGPAITAQDDIDAAREELEARGNLYQAQFQFGDFDDAASCMFADGLISNGYIHGLKGDEIQPVRWVNISQDEVAIDLGPYDKPHGFFWKREWSRRAITEAFPKGKFTDEFKTALDAKPEERVMLCQDTIYDAKEKRWRLYVYIDGKHNDLIHEADFATSRWVCFRYFRLPGEAYGFGPVLINLPLIKTLNKTVELALMGAALNALGIYTRVNDGVFNPDTARLAPGAFWTVARNGGPLGPSLAKLPAASDPNLNMLTINDMRAQVSAGMNDEAMPSDDKSPRSAAEILARISRLRRNHAGAFARIVHDVILSLLAIVDDLLVEQNIIKSGRLHIDQMRVKVKVVSPLGAAFRARRAETFAQWAEAVLALGGAEALREATAIERSLVDMGLDMGVPQSRMRSPTQQDDLRMRVQEGVAKALEMMKAQGPAPPPPMNGDPAQAMAA